jgi:hypothetical protein
MIVEWDDIAVHGLGIKAMTTDDTCELEPSLFSSKFPILMMNKENDH